ncbi:MAG: septal ring lytic transglycosylase RlpA family protein [bacterium]|nr:septal ring lytic transglycosylase RlpA family protein [bacterium]
MTKFTITNRFTLIRFISILFLIALLSACTTIPVKSPQKLIGYKQFGKASYYSIKFKNDKTASGEYFNKYSNTAAHRMLPFGTKVKVTNIKNGKSVIVKINDRGPFTKGRIIDLSQSAFSSIANIDSGVINVEIEVIK